MIRLSTTGAVCITSGIGGAPAAGRGMAVRPVIIRDEDGLCALLRGRRESLGISQQALDDKVGWTDGYTAKVEAPGRAGRDTSGRGYGRRVIWGISHLLAYWLESLGLTLVIMDKAQAEALIAASTDPDMAESMHTPYPGRNRRREVVQRRVFRTGISFPIRAAA